jgi:hypothetical protein
MCPEILGGRQKVLEEPVYFSLLYWAESERGISLEFLMEASSVFPPFIGIEH